MIRQRALGKTGLQVSEIGFGALEIGRDWAADVNPDPSHLSFPEAETLLHALLDMGVNFIDTAPAYWNSEDFIGRALQRRRDEYVLATKVGERCDRQGSFYDYSGAATLDFIEQSLKNLRTDRIDLIQIHSASMEVLNRGETLDALREAREAGKVRFIGMSGGVNEAIRAIELGFDTVQVAYNMLNLAAEERLLPLAKQTGVGVIIMRPLAGGKLTSKYTRHQKPEVREAIGRFVPVADGGDARNLGSLAIRFVLSSDAVSTIIAGSRRKEAIEENIQAAARPLPAEQASKVREVSRSLTVSAW